MEFALLVVGLLAGGGIGAYLGIRNQRQKQAEEEHRLEQEARERSERILKEAEKDAETARKDAELKAEEIRLDAQKDAEAAHAKHRAELKTLEDRLNQRAEKLDTRSDNLDNREAELNKSESELGRKQQSLSDKERHVESLRDEIRTKLEEVARMSAEEAREQIIKQELEQAKLEAAKTVREIETTAIEEAERRAKKVLSVAIQRYAGEFVSERCVSVVQLPNDDMKGRIIGREGRNIRALEAATGIDLIVDDTPEAVIISGFDPVRREVARQSLERLIADGRIHPTRIEEVVSKTEKEVDKIIREAGDQASFELGLTGLHSEVLRLVGRLKYRTSYGQNQWSHSIEVGFLCGLMASELGLNVKLARRCGLLHDIGKAMDHEQEGSHAILGAQWAKKHGEKDIVVNAIAAHHDEVKPTSVFAHLVMAADAMSGARPGARREILESYVKRLEDLERISKSFNGVSECFAIQAGREIRVMVENNRISDDEAHVLSRDIARKIEEELVYPGQIKVTVIRETRAVEYAR